MADEEPAGGAALVKVPSLEVVPITQQYMVTNVGREGTTALYRGSTDKVHELTTDPDHVVLDYPFLAERVRARPRTG
ncbi:hypothetical protein GCM10027176_70070 [Actinoallomurus bryophytorum]|uniref:putative glycolipid-binding domain-containing protein n=1 Tax=Actinoallomurus bryophytorum TaxID=1490222 RepID=UPI0011536F03|nr:putative glycolipid-binding domain-containing protein [Actinoallomurus bryophytorum]